MQDTTLPKAEQSPALFSAGMLIVITPNALSMLEKYKVAPAQLIIRHTTGDWGNVSPEHAATNNEALRRGGRILSSYSFSCIERVWIVTEPGRCITTMLVPEAPTRRRYHA